MIFHILLILYFVTTNFSRAENNLIFDYFNYKSVKSVAGFSCNIQKDDLLLIKSFNKFGIAATFRKINNEIQIYRLAYTIHQKLGVLLDLRCYDPESVSMVFSEATDHRMFDGLHNWFIIGSDITSVLKILDDTAFGYSTDFVIAIPSITTSGYALHDVYNLWKERRTTLNVVFMGFWNDKKLNLVINKRRYEQRSNLHGVIMKASFYDIPYKPHDMALENYLQEYTSSTRDSISKFGYTIISHLSEMFNFKVQCIMASKWKEGDPVGPMAQTIYRNEADITGTPSIISEKRMKLVRFTHQLWPFRTCFIFRSPQSETIKINEVSGPLSDNVWYLTGAVCILSACILTYVFRWENNERLLTRFSDSFLITFGALSQQGSDIAMNLLSTRIVLFCIVMFSYFLFNYYSACIVSIRLNQPIYKINDSLNQLIKSNLKLVSESMVYFEFFIKKQDWETKNFAERWLSIPEVERWMEPEKALRLVQKGGYAFHVHPEIAYPYINRWYDNREICELNEVHLQPLVYCNIGLHRNSTIVEMIRIGLSRIFETSVRKRQIIRWMVPKPSCNQDLLSASSINIYEFAPHLLILTFGIGIAAVLYILERLKSRRIYEL